MTYNRGVALLAYLEVEATRLLRQPQPPQPTDATTPRVDSVQQFGRLFSRGVSALSQALQLPEGAGGGGCKKDGVLAADSAAEFWSELSRICWCPVRYRFLISLDTY